MLYKLFLAVICFSSGAMCHYAMAPYNMPLVLFAGLPILYYALLRAERKRITFLYTWLFAFGYFVFGLSWVANALLVPGNEEFQWVYPIAIVGLPAALALFPAFCVTFITRNFDLEHISGWFTFVFALAVSEIARGFLFTGFPWNNFGYTWISVMPIAQIASIGGLYFLGTLTIFWAAAPALMFLHKRGFLVLMIFVIASGSMAGSYFWGWQKMQSEPVYLSEKTIVHLIQPNIVQQDKWKKDKMQGHVDTLITLSEQAIKDHANKTNIIIWPETATVSSLLSRPQNKAALNKILPSGSKNILLSGLLRVTKGTDRNILHNSLVALGADQEILGVYDKHHLVPFGEYIPFQHLIPISTITNFSGFKAGIGNTKIQLNQSISISPLICYEIIFPGKTLPEVKVLPNLIVNVTNDAWYGNSSGPRQHMAQSRLRAIETGTPVARVANTGISSLIAHNGILLAVEEYGKRGFQGTNLPLKLANKTVFAIYGQKIVILLLCILLCFAFILRKRK